MRETLRNAWKIVEIRKKILYTLGMLLIYRLLCYIPTPGVDTSAIAAILERYSILGFIQSMTGSNFSNYNIMAMGITPVHQRIHYHAAAVRRHSEARRASEAG